MPAIEAISIGSSAPVQSGVGSVTPFAPVSGNDGADFDQAMIDAMEPHSAHPDLTNHRQLNHTSAEPAQSDLPTNNSNSPDAGTQSARHESASTETTETSKSDKSTDMPDGGDRLLAVDTAAAEMAAASQIPPGLLPSQPPAPLQSLPQCVPQPVEGTELNTSTTPAQSGSAPVDLLSSTGRAFPAMAGTRNLPPATQTSETQLSGTPLPATGLMDTARNSQFTAANHQPAQAAPPAPGQLVKTLAADLSASPEVSSAVSETAEANGAIKLPSLTPVPPTPLQATGNSEATELGVLANAGGKSETVTAEPEATANLPETAKTQTTKADHLRSEIAGMGFATVASAMKNTSNQNKVAELDAKVLPGTGASAMADKTLPAQLTPNPVTAPENSGTNLNLAYSSQQTAIAEELPPLPKLDLPSLTDVRARSLDLVHDTLSLHAVRMVEAKSDSMSVVIKPMAGTELALELRQRDGFVEAHATLQNGDRQWLSQHWPELQQRMEQRGVKLSLLGGEQNSATGDNGNSSQQRRTPREEEAQQASAFAEFVVRSSRVAPRTGGASARSVSSLDGWEWWA